MPSLQGRRIYTDIDWPEAQPGDYWKPKDRPEGEWWFRDPFGTCGRVTLHSVEEHEDGTITVRPSIAPPSNTPQTAIQNYFHGWLTKGVWTW